MKKNIIQIILLILILCTLLFLLSVVKTKQQECIEDPLKYYRTLGADKCFECASDYNFNVLCPKYDCYDNFDVSKINVSKIE